MSAANSQPSSGAPRVDRSLHVRWPILGEAERAAVLGVLDRGVLSGPFAPEVRALEREFAAYVGVKYALATNSGTAALHMALAAAGVGPGDEVITTAFSFVATAMAVLHQNAIPVFVDIEPRTLGMDPARVEAAITPRTRALLPVHIHGMPCDLAPLLELARRHGLVLIEDAAQAHGATLGGQQVGSFGALSAFSLQSSKNLAAGEGGLCVTNDEQLFLRANRTRMFGEEVTPADEAGYRLDRPLDGTRAYDSKTMGWMYRTNELSAAIARTQLRRLDEFNARGQGNAALLNERLRQLPGITPPLVPPDRTSVFHKYRVRFDATRLGIDLPPTQVRAALLRGLAAEGVDAVLWQTKPVPGQALFQEQIGFGRGQRTQGPGSPWDRGPPVDYDLGQFPETTRLLEGSICLFSHSFPIYAQPLELAAQYADAFEAVWQRLPALVSPGGDG